MTGKMARAADNTDSQSGMSLSGGGSASEEALAKIWTEVLRLPSVEADANFFDIGGDSMKAMEVIVRAGQTLHVELPLMAFFEDPTIAHLAAVVDELSGGRSASEEALAKIWTEVLRLPSVEANTNFFDIGGDSMKAMEVITRVSEVLHVELPLMAFFEDPTIAHLGAVVDELTGGGAAPTIARVPGRREFPLSYSQQVFWLLEQQNAGTGIYNTARIFRVRGKVDAAILERSLNELRRRHEILQVRFVRGADGPIQIVDPGAPLQLAVADLSALNVEARERGAQKLALETVREPFDLEAGPALRARLVRLSADDFLLCIAIHHVISDGYTGSIFLDELSAIYDAFAEGQPSPLPELEVHFTDYAAWERESIAGPRLEEDLDYWRPVLKGAPTSVDLPVDHERLPASDRHGHLRSVTMPMASLERLRALAQSNGATLFTVLAAGFRILLYRWSGQADFLIGTIASNRSRSRTERMIGCFVNPLPLRNPVTDGQSVLDLIHREKNAVMNAFAHQDCPFTKIVEAINPERTGNDNPLFNVALLLQSFPAIAVKGRCFEAEDINFDAEVGLIDLRFIAFETPVGLQIDCEYRSAVFEIETIDKLLTSYVDVLTQMVTAPETEVAQIEIAEDLAQRGAEHRRARHRQTIAIAANFTAEPVEGPLAFWMEELRIPSQIEFAPFDQVFQQLLDPGSLLANNSDGFNIVFFQWRAGRASGDQARELAGFLKTAAARGAAPILLCVCPPVNATEEQVLAAELAGQTGVHVVYPKEILDMYPVEIYRDEYADAVGAIPYTPDFFVALASMAARRIYSLRSTPYKVIALDCDNTLWKGVCGEEGPLGVEVDAPRRALQEFMLAQREAGMLLCLCSKNAESDVAAVFESNPGMLLRSDHIVASRINWQSKSENLKDLARTLNLGVDSFILVDDNPLECAEVRANCPGALVLELPADAAKIPDALRHMWAFDHWTVTQEDQQRTELYRQELEREQSRSATGDLAQFLRSLDLKIDIRPMQPDDVARVSQLTQRTNQFNCTTIRRSEAEIAVVIESGAECLVVEVRDRFGDYGLVGVAMFAAQPDTLSVDTLLMSCRALGRRVEHHILSNLGRIAMERGLERVDVMFVPSAKNRPAFDFLESLESQLRSTGNGGSVYSFPAAYAAEAHNLAVADVEQSQQPMPVAVIATEAPRADLARIASELGSVKAVARAIQSLPKNTAVETGFLKPRSATEEILGGIWAALLRTSPPGIHDDFFRLGGNSLLAVQVISRVRQALGVEMPLRAMFEEPTLAGFAQRIEAARRAQTGTVMPPLVKMQRPESLPPSFAQQRLWFIDQLEPENPIYNIPQMYRLHGELNREALEEAIHEIVRRHEALRTTFDNVDGQPVQRIASNVTIPLPVEILTALAAANREIEIERIARENALQPFDLAIGPLLRAKLLKLEERQHVLLITLHHIIGDGWSGNLLATELIALYEAFSQGRPSPLPELTVQYADFAIWQRSWLQGEALDKQVAYWSKQLAGAPAVLELPTDRPRPAVQRHRGAVSTHMFSLEFLSNLKALSQAEGVTLFMTLLAGFQLLLSRYSGQEDIIVGSPVAGRNYTEIEPLIGFFVNTLALRTDLSGNPTFRELLTRVRQVALDGFAQQEIPFERLVEELRPERSLSYNPIFQVHFGLQGAPKDKFVVSNLEIERTAVHQSTSVFDLSWFAVEMADGLQLRVEYDTDLFDETTINRMVIHFETLMESIATHTEGRVLELTLLGDEERHQLLIDFNRTAADYPRVCIHDLIAQQAERQPEATALVDGERRISYGELNSRANRIAHYLIERGAGPDIPVGIYSERNAELVISILGILKSGSPYVPLDPEYPKERLGYILEDANPPIVLTQNSLGDELPAFAGITISVDTDWEKIASEPDTNPITALKPSNLAYVLFTSGSTGRPKGVALEHKTPVTFIHWAQTVFTPKELSGVLFSTSVCFDVSMFEMFVTLSAGGKLIVAPNALHLPTLPAKDEVTLINVVPSVMAEMVRAGGLPHSLQTINLAGEALPDSLVQQIYAVTSASKVYNLYGPTETSYATFTLVPQDAAVTIGKPLSNTQCYILDKQLSLVPIGVTGELYIAGDGVARGYYGRPDLTRERFVRNPFGGDHGARMYRTGDTCRWLQDGNIQYLGRLDHQVKLRGFRIELGEIEATLDKHPAVRQSVVMVREDEPGLRRLVAYVVLRAGETAGSEGLREHVRRNLPDFMTPTFLMVLETLPQTPNGKIDRKALPAPEYSRDSSAECIPPRTTTEETIEGIWAEVLKLDHAGVTDNFFELGGHSLLATQVVSRIRQTLGVELPLRYLFEYPTISELALRVDERTIAISPAQHTIQRVPRDRPLPLSFAQQRMWFLDQLEPGQPLFNIPCAQRVDSMLDLDILQRAIDALVERHETLRSNFSATNGEPVQTVAASVHIPVQLVDLSHLLLRNESELEAMRFTGSEARRPFDLARDPLLRVFVVRLSRDAHILLLNIHHIISDRWSITVLLHELSVLYGAFSEGKSSPLPGLPVQYADFAAWQREASQSEDFDRQLHYWMEELKDAPPLIELPTDHPRPPVASLRGEVAHLLLSPELTQKLNHLSRISGATLFMTLLAGFEVLLSRYSGQEDMVIGMPIASRSHREVEGLIGLFANTLPVRLRLTGNPDFREVLARTKSAALGAYAHQDVPFERLVEELNPERNLSYDALVQVYFILQNAPNEGLRLSGLELKHIETDSKTSKGDMYFSLAEHGGGIDGRLEYNTDLFDAATIERMLDHYRTLLESTVENPERHLSELEILSAADRTQLLVEWNDTAREYNRDTCLHQLFEDQVARRGDAVAVSFGEQSISYRELNDRANQLAHYLGRHGVGVGQRVGLFVERSLDMFVGLLGIQKSGAAYVPLDPSYPQERIRGTLQAAGITYLVTLESLLPVLKDYVGAAVCLDRDQSLLAKEGSNNPSSGVTANDVVYVIFTSGSTGRPKGVELGHRGVVNLLKWMQEELHFGEEDVFPALASFAFDMSVPELYLALISGARVALAGRHLAGDGEELKRFLRLHRASIVHATPTTWSLLLDAGFTGKGLTRCIGAEPLPADLFMRLMLAAEGTSLYNFYGPTETTVWSTFRRFESPSEPLVIGRPLANTQVYIVDRDGNPAPAGVPGEILIGGDGVAKGYLNQPELTAEKFIPDRFSTSAEARLYRTGDLGKYLHDGRIQFAGRIDHQVKIRGYRVELGEIETVLGSHPSVQECVVIAREDVPGDKRLVGYVVPAAGTRIDPSELRLWVKKSLPDYMIPVAWVEMERLPLSPNGKIDRKNLPVPDYLRPEFSVAFQQPRTPTEEIIAVIWAELLKLDQVGSQDDFFELGGHSLLATQVMSRIRQAFQLDLPLRALFENPNVAALAECVETMQRRTDGFLPPPIQPVPRDRPLPLSFPQQRLWVQDQIEPNNPLYNIPRALRLKGTLNLSALEAALNAIVERHEIMRTTYRSDDAGHPFQIIGPAHKPPLPIVDLSDMPVGDREKEARRIVQSEAVTPFNLASDPMTRNLLLQMDDEDHILLMTTHHIASDGWSTGILLRELSALYVAALNGTPSILPALPIQYADFAVWQRSWLQGEILEQQLTHWRTRLDGAPPLLALPSDRPRSTTPTFRGVMHRFLLPPGLVDAVRALGRQRSATAFMTLLAAFECMIFYFTRDPDIVLGTDLANRTNIQTEGLIGFFVNLLVLRTDLSGDPTFEVLLGRVREVALGAYAHQDVPFDKLVEELQPERNISYHPLVQVLFVQHNAPQTSSLIPGVEMSTYTLDMPSKFDMAIFVSETDKGISGIWHYNPDLFDATTIARMASLYQLVLKAVTDNPTMHLNSLMQLLAETEQHERATLSKEFQEISLQKLKNFKRKAITLN